jgi:hypothetical protein
MPTVNKRIRNKKTKRIKRGGHEIGDDHYHLWIRLPIGQTFELGALFVKSNKSKHIKSATVGQLKQVITDRLWGTEGFMKHGTNEPREFTLFWHGKALLNPNAKIRRIVADGKKLEHHLPNKEPIMFVYDDDLEYPGIVETDYVADASS